MGLVGFTLSAAPRYPTGTVIGAYPKRSFPGPRPQDGQATNKTPVATATVGTDGRATFLPQLEEETAYYAGALVNGTWVWTEFRTPEVPTGILGEQARAEAAEKRLEALIKELGGATVGTPGGERLLFGMNSNSSKGHAATWTASKVIGDRSDTLDVEHTASPEAVSSAVAASMALGCKPLVIINTPDSEVVGHLNKATYGANCKAIIERVLRDHPTVNVFQLMNEPYYKGSVPHGSKVGSNGVPYGEACKAAYEAVEKAGLLGRVTLLIESFGEYNSFSSLANEEAQTQSGVFFKWNRSVAIAFGAYKTAIQGWSMHPYGNLGPANAEQNFNWGSVAAQRATITEEGCGGAGNIWITEIGWQSEATQVLNMQGMLEKALAAHEEGWLKAVFLYDDGDAEWSLWGGGTNAAGATLRSFAALHG